MLMMEPSNNDNDDDNIDDDNDDDDDEDDVDDDDNEDDDDDGDVGAVVGLEVDILAEEAEGYPLHPTYNPPHTVTE